MQANVESLINVLVEHIDRSGKGGSMLFCEIFYAQSVIKGVICFS